MRIATRLQNVRLIPKSRKSFTVNKATEIPMATNITLARVISVLS